MLFTSLNFLLFFPLVVIAIYLTPRKYRILTLLIASYFFYMNTKPVYAFLTIGITLSTYLFTRQMDRTASDDKKRRYMIANIIIIILPLLFFKYFNVINSELLDVFAANNLHWPFPDMKYMLPVGISYYTFMSIGYTVDVYNEEIEAEKNIGIVALFVSFFPLILSGPIERAKNMMPQFRQMNPLEYHNISAGLKKMLWGYFLKLVVADRIGIYVDAVYGSVSDQSGSSLLIASTLYPFQVYADLGGYSLIAIGVAKVMGFNVIPNFQRPFFATSMAEFWRRWHMSLITWLTDYIYTPLSFAFRSIGIWGIVASLMVTFLIAGLWHYASLTMIFWGLLQGVFLSIEAISNKKRSAFVKKYGLSRKTYYLVICMLITFSMFASSQVFGRADNLSDAFKVFDRIFSDFGRPYLDLTTIAYAVFGLLIVMLKDFSDEFFPGKIKLFAHRKPYVRYPAYLAIVFLIILFGVFDTSGFIYFQF